MWLPLESGLFIRNRRKKRKEELWTCQGFKSRKIEKAGRRHNYADELFVIMLAAPPEWSSG